MRINKCNNCCKNQLRKCAKFVLCSNKNEKIQNILRSSEYIDSDTITEQLLILLDMGDKYKDVITKLTEQETARFNNRGLTE